MRILHVIPQFPYFGGRTIVGGHASCLLTLSLAQYDAGHSVTILSHSSNRSGTLNIDNGPGIFYLLPDAKVRTFRFGFGFCTAAASWLRKRASDFDVVHVHSGYSDYFLLSRLLKKVAGLPTMHTMYCPINPHGRAHWPGIRRLTCLWAKNLDWVGGISNNVVSSMVDYGMQNAERVRPAVDTDRFAPKNIGSDFRRKMGVQVDEILLLFVGNALPQKNLDGVLRAVHQLQVDFPNLRLLITTELKHSSSDNAMKRIAALIAELNLEACVIQKGVVDNIPELMQSSDILVAPFLDSYGPSDYFMAALEAMAAGKPVVVSDVGGMSEVISSDVGTLIDPKDIASIVVALRVYCSDTEYRRRIGANARKLVVEQFSPCQIVSGYQSIYRRITT
jgi:glycosyltransferase involved in cell wall biosynthesis